MPRSPTPPRTYLQARALTVSHLDFGMVLPYCSYVVSEPNPLNLSCPSSPEHGQRESMGVCACHCRCVPKVQGTAGMVQWRLEPSWMSSCGSPWFGGFACSTSVGHKWHSVTSRSCCAEVSISGAAVCEVRFSYMISALGMGFPCTEKDWKFLWGGSSWKKPELFALCSPVAWLRRSEIAPE